MPKPSSYRDDEMKIHGRNAALAVFKKRPQDIIKAYVQKNESKIFSELLKECAKRKRAYKLTEENELEKITASHHHEGICLIVKNKKNILENTWLESLKNSERQKILFLNGVSNPHNIGNILRSAAHFGVRWIASDKFNSNTLPPATWRIAEGGMEFVDVLLWKNPVLILRELKKRDFDVIGTSSHAKESVFNLKSSPRRIIILGEESFGMDGGIEKECTRLVKIPGTGNVESLNVASSAAVMMGHP